MGLSCILRISLNACKARPSFGLASQQIKPLSSSAYDRLNAIRPHLCTVERKMLGQKQQLNLVNALRNLSTTPIKASSAAHDHAKIWTIEKALSASLLVVMPLGIMLPNVLFDLIMAVPTVMHVHWGVEAIVIDYVRPIIFGKIIPKIAVASVYVFSIFLLVGLLNLTFRGPGIGNSVRSLWKI